jgi:plasmid replication initiation protein
LPQLEVVIDELHSTILKLKLTRQDGTGYIKSGPILSDAERDTEASSRAELRYTLSPTIRRAIADSKHWAVISKRAVLAFQSKYALRLYTLISLRVGLRKTSEIFLLEDLKQILGIPNDAYPRFGNLKQKVLDPAISELNQLAGFQIGYTPQLSGRSVKAVRIFWGIKSKQDRIEAFKELERPKTGRKARRENNDVLIAPNENITRHQLAQALSKISLLDSSD